MSLKIFTVLLVVLCCRSEAQDAAPPWAAEMNAGRVASSSGKYSVAAESYAAALAKAETSGASEAAILPVLRAFATALRSNSDHAGAQQVIERMLLIVKKAGEQDLEAAAILSDLAVVQRAQDFREEAVASLQQAMSLRRRSPLTEQSARDTTLIATLFHEMGQDDKAGQYFEAALYVWGTLPDTGLQILTALDPLAAIRRNERRYERAEELYTWELRLQEAALGPKDPELIATLDSLAYVLFGLKKYAEAEPIYNRLLALWELVGGADHPMVALTLDKMAEFYLDQRRYDEAQPLVQRALTIRSKAEIETLHRVGRVLAGQRKLEEALDVYGRAIRIAAEAKLPDEDIPGTLRAYALLLRDAQRDKEAIEIDKRLRESIENKERREGKRVAPPATAPKLQKI